MLSVHIKTDHMTWEWVNHDRSLVFKWKYFWRCNFEYFYTGINLLIITKLDWLMSYFSQLNGRFDVAQHISGCISVLVYELCSTNHLIPSPAEARSSITLKNRWMMLPYLCNPDRSTAPPCEMKAETAHSKGRSMADCFALSS